MKRQTTIKAAVASLVAGAVILLSLNAGGGSLEPNSPPGPTMHTLDEIYAMVSSDGEPEPMAYDAFLKIEGLNGESSDQYHKDWIDLLSYSHGIQLPNSGTGGITSPPVHEDFSVVKELDKASPKLYLHCCNGQRLNQVIMELCKATGDKQKFMEYVFTDVIISSVRPGGSAQTGEPLPVEEVTFNYGKIEWTYTEYDSETGLPIGDVRSYWDIRLNEGG